MKAPCGAASSNRVRLQCIEGFGVAMASGKALFGAVVGRFLFREVETADIRNLGSSFRLVTFGGDSMRSAAWEAGDKIQVYLPDHGMRTYTPMTWNAGARAELLIYVHGTSPGADWGRRLCAGDRWQFFGPRRSIRAKELDGSVVLFGDETSFGVARALADAKGAANMRCVFEVNDVEAAREVLAAIGLDPAAAIARHSAAEHLETTCDRLIAELEASQSASLVMTGKAQSIQVLRSSLKARGALRAGKVKAYWSVGKTGLD